MGTFLIAGMLLLGGADAPKRYYAHDAVEDRHGVIAPWYRGQNGQCDWRVRIAAETLKRYPWTDTARAAAAAPEYIFSGAWKISPEGAIVTNVEADHLDYYKDLGWIDEDMIDRVLDMARGTTAPVLAQEGKRSNWRMDAEDHMRSLEHIKRIRDRRQDS